MILVCIAIRGDNLKLAEQELAQVLEVQHFEGGVYRAWVDITHELHVNQTLRVPKEVEFEQ